MATVLYYQGFDGHRWIRSYSGGEGASALIHKVHSTGLNYTYTRRGDPKFLWWVSQTRRTAVIFYYSNHAVTFVGFENHNNVLCAKLLDNNYTRNYKYIPIDKFLYRWKRYFGGFSLTLVHNPPKPEPWR